MNGGQSNSKRERSAHIVHEMNQPLAAILMNAEAALRWLTWSPPNLEEARQAIERIVGNSRRAHDVVVQIAEGVRRSHVAPVDLNDIIWETTRFASLDLERYGIVLEVVCASALAPVHGDSVQLGRVVANLVTNGIEAMRSVEGRSRQLRIVSETDRAGNITVSVADTGIGFDPRNIERIFDPMFTTKEDGTGLGLSMCRSIVEAHGGRLWAQNTPIGSTFHFAIPSGRGAGPPIQEK